MSHQLTVVSPPPLTSLAPGFRFHPSDEELVMYYLRRKVCALSFRFQAVAEIDVYKSEPWELAGLSPLTTRDREWYFFSPVDKKHKNGSRLNRATGQGFWKVTGKDRVVRHNEETIGLKKTLVYHTGRAPGGKRTDWVMHEYRLSDYELKKVQAVQGVFVLCRIFEKSGLGPPNGRCYAPFVEEEWHDDVALFIPDGEADDEMSKGEGVQNYLSQVGTQTVVSKRERLLDLDLNSEPELENNKRSKQSEDSFSNDNSSDDSVTTNEETRTSYYSSMLLEVKQAKVMIKNLQSRVDQLTAENGELRRAVK